jgi:hypothetical protein
MVESLVLKQHQVEVFEIVSSTYRKHNHIFDGYGPIECHFGGLEDTAIKTALLNG